MNSLAPLLLIGVLAVGQTVTAQAPAPDPAFLIVPGQSIGKYNLGWTVSQFRAELGRENAGGTFETGSLRDRRQSHIIGWYSWHEKRVNLWTRPDLGDMVIGIGIEARPNEPDTDATNRKYRTAEGIGLYSTLQEIDRAYSSHFITKRSIGTAGDRYWYRNGMSFDFLFSNPVPSNVAGKVQVVLIAGWQ